MTSSYPESRTPATNAAAPGRRQMRAPNQQLASTADSDRLILIRALLMHA